MTSQHDLPKRWRPMQFSLRRLLLWTAVIALYLAVMRMMELSLIGFTLATIWLTIVGILRLLIGTVPTAITSVLGGPLGIVGFAFVEATFYITGLVDGQLGRPVTTGVNDLPPGHRRDFGYATGACLVALLGTIVPITTLLHLWAESGGTQHFFA